MTLMCRCMLLGAQLRFVAHHPHGTALRPLQAWRDAVQVVPLLLVAEELVPRRCRRRSKLALAGIEMLVLVLVRAVQIGERPGMSWTTSSQRMHMAALTISWIAEEAPLRLPLGVTQSVELQMGTRSLGCRAVSILGTLLGPAAAQG